MTKIEIKEKIDEKMQQAACKMMQGNKRYFDNELDELPNDINKAILFSLPDTLSIPIETPTNRVKENNKTLKVMKTPEKVPLLIFVIP